MSLEIEKRALELIKDKTKMLIGGKWVDSESGETYPSHDPATGRLLTRLPSATAKDVDLMVQAAEKGFHEWRRVDTLERGRLVAKLGRALREKAMDLGILDAIDCGNPVTAMKGDALIAAEQLEYFGGLASEIKGETFPGKQGNLHYTLREPFGVVARIVPFNHPIYFAGCKIGAPLVAGNTVILKPAGNTCLSALELGKIASDILPPGVVNVITGSGGKIGAPLVSHRLVRRIALTGGVDTGREIQRQATEGGIKSVTLELGGKNPMIIFADVELDQAVASATLGMNFHWCQGQSCGSTSRLFLHKKIHDAFMEKLIRKVESINIGLPLDEDTEMGCLVSKDQFDKTLRYIEYGKEEGAKLATGGKKPEGTKFANGFFVLPTIFDQCKTTMRIAREEIFGPVLSVFVWEDLDEVIAQANGVEYGLTASVWSNDLRMAHRTASKLEAGYIWINGSSRHFTGAPFGGFKNSGIGREESLEEMMSYTQIKTVHTLLD
jgi:betaine-aldehyde dehydrogenase